MILLMDGKAVGLTSPLIITSPRAAEALFPMDRAPIDFGADPAHFVSGTLDPAGMDENFLRIIPFIGQSLIWREPVPPRRSKGWRRHVRAQKAAKR